VSKGRHPHPPTEDSIVDILRERAASLPARRIFCWLDEGEFEGESLTYAELDRRARAVAAAIQSRAQPGDRVLVVYDPGIEFIVGLFGCLYAGTMAVPCAPPRMELAHEGMKSLARVAGDCQPRVIVTGGELAAKLPGQCAAVPSLAELSCLDTGQIADGAGAGWSEPHLGRRSRALLQYTSGSTGAPRGVSITHGNILHNEFVIQHAFRHWTALGSGNGVCWLPLYHDMGLIGNALQAVYVDAPCFLMSPLIFLRHPICWLRAITRYRTHSSGGPNFAYDLCVQRITDEQKQTLDLSDWEVAYIGAEPVSPATLDRFAAAFAPCGFQREAFYPCYGLAEATLFVSGGNGPRPAVLRSFPVESPSTSSTLSTASTSGLVGCGRAWPDHEIAIVDPATGTVCPDGAVGEIWFAGPSVAEGYWNDSEETTATFQAALSDSGRGPFLRTGDLGRMVDGELFVTGRLKDLIIIHGRNFVPHDIEETVRSVHEAFRPNRGAALGCQIDGEERLVILQEIDRQSRRLDIRELARNVRQVIAERHQLQVADVRFLRNDSLPRTSSGKVRRFECKEQYLAGRLIDWKGKDP
jgi:acyl-CoA synthetase (AMP-forming)/AMP-acid ligase II